MFYEINKEEKLREYHESTQPEIINTLDYVEFDVEEHTYQLREYHINNIFGELFREYDSFNDILEIIYEISQTLEDCSLSEIYNQIYDPSAIEMDEWFNFDEEFFETFLHDRSPYDVALMTYFGKIQSWSDPYIRFNAYGNLETTDEIDYEPYANEILQEWVREKYL